MTRGFFNHKGRPGMTGGSLPRSNLNQLFLILKGSSRSGNYGHAGRKGKRGGSASKSGSAISQEEFRKASNYISPHTKGYELASSGGLELSRFSRLDEFSSKDDRDYLVERSLKTKSNKIKGLVTEQTFSEFENILNGDKFKLEKDSEFYFGVSGDHSSQLGDEFSFKGSRTAGLTPDRASNYAVEGGTIFKIKAKKGQKAVFTDVFDLPEVVFLPGSKMRRTGKIEDVNGKKVVEVELVEDGTKFTSNFVNFANDLDSKL